MRFEGIKWEHGADDPNRGQNRDCPRNCERRANLDISTDHKGWEGKESREAQVRRPANITLTLFGRGVPRDCDEKRAKIRKLQLHACNFQY